MARKRASNGSGVIESEADIRLGVRALRRTCGIMRRAHDVAGDPPLRRREPGLEGLTRIIIGQQLSIASAAAIWGRLEATLAPFGPARLIEVSDEDLRGAGLSGPKIRTLRALGRAIADDGLDLEALTHASEEEVHARLTALSGIGPWTADVYIMFCLGRRDAFAAGDLALQIAAQHAADLPDRPSVAALADLAERWRPWRGVAARLLWAYYAHRKQAKPAAAKNSGMPM